MREPGATAWLAPLGGLGRRRLHNFASVSGGLCELTGGHAKKKILVRTVMFLAMHSLLSYECLGNI